MPKLLFCFLHDCDPNKTEKLLAPFVRKMDNAIQRIIHYPLDSVVCFVNTCPLHSDLSGVQRYPAFEQLGPRLDR